MKRLSTHRKYSAPGSRPFILTAGLTAVALTSLVTYKTLFQKTAYTVTRVIDGDTFETQEKQIIRINGIQAPETGLCGSGEAKETLEKVILSKRVYLKVVYFDRYRRQVADVYLRNGKSLAQYLAASGSVYVHQKSGSSRDLLDAGNDARDAKRGIYGEPCTQETNTESPECIIKGNIPDGEGGKTYHLPGCRAYTITKVELSRGDQWFCSEREAEKAGFRKAETCP